ncbi:MAG: sugar nucleotide-binding protein [Lentisphaeria bacterium]|nr:sugar nucleotide-binding protein [Lentisphaeria bacterium]
MGSRHLIFGAGGFLGRHLMAVLKRSGVGNYLGTGVVHLPAEHGCRFDLLHDSIADLPPEYRSVPDGSGFAVICSAISRIDQCRSNPASRLLNVEKTVELSCRLADAGYQVCFISSDQVFDGKRGGYTETDAVNPVNAYGQQKAETETLLQQKIPERLLIARLSKQVCSFRDPANVFTQWEQTAQEGRQIRHIDGMELSFTDAADTAKVLLELAARRVCGIFHVCGKEHFTRDRLCREYLTLSSLNAETVNIPLEEFHFQDNRPLKTWLNSNKLTAIMPIGFTPMKELIKLYIKTTEETGS